MDWYPEVFCEGYCRLRLIRLQRGRDLEVAEGDVNVGSLFEMEIIQLCSRETNLRLQRFFQHFFISKVQRRDAYDYHLQQILRYTHSTPIGLHQSKYPPPLSGIENGPNIPWQFYFVE